MIKLKKIMSEYTSVYLRKKGAPLMKYRDYPSYDEIKDLPEEELQVLEKEREAHNEKVSESLGCELFYLCTTPSRQLEVLPWTENPQFLTKELLVEVLAFYDKEIEDWKRLIQRNKNNITHLEERICKVNVDLYDKINEEISCYRRDLEECQEELEDTQFFRSKFAFVKEIMENNDNKERYELIYTKC